MLMDPQTAFVLGALVGAGDDLARLEDGLSFLTEQVRVLTDEQRVILRRLPPPGTPTGP